MLLLKRRKSNIVSTFTSCTALEYISPHFQSEVQHSPRSRNEGVPRMKGAGRRPENSALPGAERRGFSPVNAPMPLAV